MSRLLSLEQKNVFCSTFLANIFLLRSAAPAYAYCLFVWLGNQCLHPMPRRHMNRTQTKGIDFLDIVTNFARFFGISFTQSISSRRVTPIVI